MFKNVASQKVALLALDSATGRPKTGDAANITPYVSQNFGTPTVLATATATEMDATNAKGWYSFSLAQAETNADALLFTGKSSTSGIDIVGNLIYTTPPNFTALSVDSSGNAKVQTGIKKNTAINAYEFVMTDSTTHNPVAGKTVTATRSIDGAAFASASNAVTELSNGVYIINLSAADMNGNTVTFRFVASGCDDLFVLFLTTP